MPNWYTNRWVLKDALSIPATATGDHDQLDGVLEGVSRLVDAYVGFNFYPTSGIRYFTAHETTCLDLPSPLTAVDSIRVDDNGDASYGTTLSTSDYWLTPYNATAESPARPYWGLESRLNATATLSKIPRGVEITGTWGYYNQTATTPVTLSTDLASGATAGEFSNSSLLHVGMTLLIGSERILVTRNGKDGSDTATTSGNVGIQRGVNGSSGATHSGGDAVNVYEYPVVERATLYQAQMDYRGKDAPLGYAGGDPFAAQQLQTTRGGLHPFTKRMLEPFRAPVVG